MMKFLGTLGDLAASVACTVFIFKAAEAVEEANYLKAISLGLLVVGMELATIAYRIGEKP